MADKDGERAAYNTLGNAYAGLGAFETATHYHKLKLEITKITGDRAGEGMAYGSLGCDYGNLGDFEEEIRCHKMSFDIAKEVGDRAGEADAPSVTSALLTKV